MTNLWTSAEHALGYLAKADQIPHRTEGEAVLLEQVPKTVKRILDLGTGDGRLLGLLKIERPSVECIAVDFSPTMLEAVKTRFANDSTVEILDHNLDKTLPNKGTFDAVVSSFAIHHLSHNRKRSLYLEIFNLLQPGGIFCNLEHVASPTPRLHEKFLKAIGRTVEQDDRSNQLLDVETQLRWLENIGFDDVDCYWKWLELALLIGLKPKS
ncbi:MAG: class I SAM-dependent methyltransferase [Richelia sp. RM2_1_2]|nr:class I SAM-dependent methyltransferase [Richelia sp. SM2_1_7]NJM23587.1 class I SAM-dependent methyltransferase [Richelia sp. SM1_7_0]NJN08528.1 class I SAM-dependent methyltransferase [Richelia sp. RM1_1_1]NJO27253.1 class I SAM-dependent methyltransferase [Richelia sp. SL_2_1]NJO57271.1 class I SAM-dependent methyltransferase [Richelia sp. RM2_1_2]